RADTLGFEQGTAKPVHVAPYAKGNAVILSRPADRYQVPARRRVALRDDTARPAERGVCAPRRLGATTFRGRRRLCCGIPLRQTSDRGTRTWLTRKSSRYLARPAHRAAAFAERSSPTLLAALPAARSPEIRARTKHKT